MDTPAVRVNFMRVTTPDDIRRGALTYVGPKQPGQSANLLPHTIIPNNRDSLNHSVVWLKTNRPGAFLDRGHVGPVDKLSNVFARSEATRQSLSAGIVSRSLP